MAGSRYSRFRGLVAGLAIAACVWFLYRHLTRFDRPLVSGGVPWDPPISMTGAERLANHAGSTVTVFDCPLVHRSEWPDSLDDLPVLRPGGPWEDHLLITSRCDFNSDVSFFNGRPPVRTLLLAKRSRGPYDVHAVIYRSTNWNVIRTDWSADPPTGYRHAVIPKPDPEGVYRLAIHERVDRGPDHLVFQGFFRVGRDDGDCPQVGWEPEPPPQELAVPEYESPLYGGRYVVTFDEVKRRP